MNVVSYAQMVLKKRIFHSLWYHSVFSMKKKKTHIHLGWPGAEEMSAIFRFCVNYSFNIGLHFDFSLVLYAVYSSDAAVELM